MTARRSLVHRTAAIVAIAALTSTLATSSGCYSAGSVRFLNVPTPSGVHRLCVTVAGAADDPLGRACLYLAAP